LDDRDHLCQVLPESRVSMLRRGIDLGSFSPTKRDRAWLESFAGAPQDRVVVFYAGRLNRGKNILILAEAIGRLVDAGAPLHLICAGEGDEKKTILERLGVHASCPGFVSGENLKRLYASCDLFAMPSEIEVFCNVIQEAMASGPPVLLSE